MTPGARIAAAIEVLSDIERRHRPVSEALRDWGVSHRFAGSKDRAGIGNIVYDALRWRSSSLWVMGEETPRAAVVGAVGRHWKLGGEKLASILEGDPHAPPQLTTAERALIDLADLAAAPPHIRADIPAWLSGRFDNVAYAINTTTGEVKSIPVGKEPHGLTIWPQPGRYSLGHTGNLR